MSVRSHLRRSQLRLHPRARPAFDAWAGLGGLGMQGVAIRTTRVDDAVLAFAGFACLNGDPEEVLRVEIIDGLSDRQITAAAWEEVEDVFRLLAMAPRLRQSFARALADNASPAQLAALGIAGGDIHEIARRLHAPLRDQPAPVRIIDAILRRLQEDNA